MTHDKNLAICIAPNGYQIDIICPSLYNKMYGQSVDQSECRSYGEDLTEEQIENLHTRIIFDVRYADGTVIGSHLEDVGFIRMGSYYYFDDVGQGTLRVTLDEKTATIKHVYHVNENYTRKYNIKNLPDLIRLTKFLKT